MSLTSGRKWGDDSLCLLRKVSANKWLNYRFVKSLPEAAVSLSASLEGVPEGLNKWQP